MKYLTIAAFAALAICSAPVMAQDEGEEAPRCVRLTNINGYSVIDRQHVVFRGGASRHYLATLRNRCPDLNFGVQLTTSFGRSATICPPAMEYITPESGFRCYIDSVEEVDSVDAARSLIEERAAADAEGETD
ncbi:DUF6491 family protein [Hyphobacterium sp. HN65]|uniref:DUF6491 family protein n=1 Tax=Hyphobacterium lacteum TaxID=3116575 RepID=A0ABU7LU84_9PROT|nr:DUF6491 family protein [Hyphobacterium sp. HN65]MEE2527176.1 DUF6491 family protein [Hyphobacterium sp. HN65]